jgi:hypothetical protein
VRSDRSFIVWLVVALACYETTSRAQEESARPFSCDAALTELFTPPRPQLGRYEVCTTPLAIAEVVKPEWPRASVAPVDAFGSAGPYDRLALAQLYGGRLATVVRGWIESDQGFVALTFVSPHPDPTLSELRPGTLVIRLVLTHADLAALGAGRAVTR